MTKNKAKYVFIVFKWVNIVYFTLFYSLGIVRHFVIYLYCTNAAHKFTKLKIKIREENVCFSNL